MSDIQDEAYSEAMDEIERLKNENSDFGRAILGLIADVKLYKSLITRAADALEAKDPGEIRPSEALLIDELRKAAK